MCGSFLRVRRKFLKDPIKSLLMSYQPELGHMAISDQSLTRGMGSFLYQSVSSWTRGWNQSPLEMWGMWYKKQSWGHIREKKDGNRFCIGSQECHCNAVNISPWRQFIFLR